MSKDSSIKYYQDTKKVYKKELVKDIRIFLKKKKKRDNKPVKDTKIYQKMVEYRKKYKVRKNVLL